MANRNRITLSRLLEEMTDFAGLARAPAPAYRIEHCSSHDRASVTPEDPEGWFANKDRGPFIRTERNQGREEHVIAEFDGPGSFCRLWTVDRRIMPNMANRGPETSIVRLYLDGDTEPAVEGLFQDVFNGTGIFPRPFAHQSLSSAVSYFPVPFARGLKITLEGEVTYYNISARNYAPGTEVESFSLERMQAVSAKVGEIGKRLLQGSPMTGEVRSEVLQIAPGEEGRVALPEGPAAIVSLGLSVDTMDLGALRGSVVRLSFDGAETVFCPIGELFGCGPGLHPFSSLTRSVDENGDMRCSWVMPYSQSAVLRVLNLDSVAHSYTLRIGVSPSSWDEGSLYFHGGWHYEFPVPTRPMSDWNYVSVEGRGRYVGDTLTVHNPVEIWWGEGDEKIWVDDDTFPSIFGTGTEDYYGYAWGGQNRAFYEHPMHAQVRVHEFDKLWNKPIPQARNTRGVSTELRNLVLDSVSFESKLKYDMEVWHWEECEMAYAVACFWYAAPGAGSTIQADPESVRRSLDDLRRFEKEL